MHRSSFGHMLFLTPPVTRRWQRDSNLGLLVLCYHYPVSIKSSKIWQVLVSTVKTKLGYWHQRAGERHGNPPQGNQELLMVIDKVGDPQVSSGWASPWNVIFFPSVLWHCWLGDRKGIRPVKNWVLVCWWWWFDWSFARVIAPVVQLSPSPPSSFASINTG